jgi:hypothetical protein
VILLKESYRLYLLVMNMQKALKPFLQRFARMGLRHRSFLPAGFTTISNPSFKK